MPLDTLQQISDALDQHSVRITTAQSTADTANTEAARALSRIYDVDLGATLYTDTEIEKLKTQLRQEFNQSLTNTFGNIDATLVDRINNQVPGMLLDRYGSYSQMVALNDALLHRFGQSDAAITTLLDTTIPGLLGTVNQLSTQSDNVAQDLNLLQNALKSVLVVYAADAAGSDQSLTPGIREYVQYVEYNGTPPTLPVTGTFTKFVGVGQSTWPIYATTNTGQDQSFEPGSRTYVTFYNSPTQPVLPVTGETFVRYIGTDGADGNTGPDGPRGAGRWMIPVTSLPLSSTAAQDAWNAAGADIPDRPVIMDQVIFYTGSVGNPTSQRAYICQWVTSDSSHGWSYQQFLMRGNLLVTGSVTTDQIDSRGLTIRDEYNNIILQATGGSAGINLSKVIGAGNMAGVDSIQTSNVSTYIQNAAIGTLQLGLNSATAGESYQFNGPRNGSGMSSGWSTAYTSIFVPAFTTAKILVLCLYEQGYPNWPTTAGWGYKIGFNAYAVAPGGSNLGNSIIAERVTTNGMAAANDTPIIGRVFTYNNTGRSYPVEVALYTDWYGQNSNIVLGKVVMSAFASWR